MKFKESLQILWRRRRAIFITLGVGVIGGIAALLFLPPQYAATANVLIVQPQQGRDPSLTSTDMPTLLLSSTVLSRTIKQLHLSTTQDDLGNRITAKVALGSSVMPITVQFKKEKDAVRTANALADNLEAYYREIASSRYNRLNDDLRKELDTQNHKLVDLDRKLQLEAIKQPIASDGDAAKALANQLVALETRRAQLQSASVGHAALAAAAGSHVSQMLPVYKRDMDNNDDLLKQLKEQYAKDASTLRSEDAQYTAGYPGLDGLKERVAREEANVTARQNVVESQPPASDTSYGTALQEKSRAEALVSGDQAELGAVQAQISQVESQLHSLPGVGVQIATLRRERDVAQSSYSSLMARAGITLAAQAEAASLGSIVVVDRAEHGYTALGKHAVLLAVGAVLGFLILAITLAFLLEATDPRLRTVDAVSGLYGKPVLATFGAR